MRFLRSLLRGLAASGFKLGLVSLAMISAAVLVFGNPTATKQALRSSKIYDTFIENVISSKPSDPNAQNPASGYYDNAAVQQAAKTAFSPVLLQSSSEQIIDSVYKWLRTGSEKPDFKIDLSAAKQKFAEAAADNALARARQLPVCTTAQLRQLSTAKFDPWSTVCVPPGYDIGSIRGQVVAELANNTEFFKNPVITADNLPKDVQGRSIFENASWAPKAYHWFMLAPWILGGVVFLSGTTILLLHDKKRRGLHNIGVTLLGSGLFLLASTWILLYALDQANRPSGRVGKLLNNGLQHAVIGFFKSLTGELGKRLYSFGGAYVLAGIAMLVVLRLIPHTTGTPKHAEEMAIANGPTDTTNHPDMANSPTNTVNEKPGGFPPNNFGRDS